MVGHLPEVRVNALKGAGLMRGLRDNHNSKENITINYQLNISDRAKSVCSYKVHDLLCLSPAGVLLSLSLARLLV